MFRTLVEVEGVARLRTSYMISCVLQGKVERDRLQSMPLSRD